MVALAFLLIMTITFYVYGFSVKVFADREATYRNQLIKERAKEYLVVQPLNGGSVLNITNMGGVPSTVIGLINTVSGAFTPEDISVPPLSSQYVRVGGGHAAYVVVTALGNAFYEEGAGPGGGGGGGQALGYRTLSLTLSEACGVVEVSSQYGSFYVTGATATQQYTYPAGTKVTLTANSTPTCAFTGWSGAVNSDSPSVTLALNSDKSVEAVYG